MALWRWRGWRWEKIRGFPLYFPPDYLRIRHVERSGKGVWAIEAREFSPLHGADRLWEALEGLIRACRRPSGEGPLLRIKHGEPPQEVEGIEPFPEEALWDQGLFLQRLRQPPDRWLLSLELARPVEGLYVSRWERYVASWGVALRALLSAVERGPA
ncbi:MAG TPA: hypothetical protein ENF15_03900 [Candidatus Acetothermia bacterium]|nr:hypothetical protein [Candidatus Acetothermia bacterium]